MFNWPLFLHVYKKKPIYGIQVPFKINVLTQSALNLFYVPDYCIGETHAKGHVKDVPTMQFWTGMLRFDLVHHVIHTENH